MEKMTDEINWKILAVIVLIAIIAIAAFSFVSINGKVTKQIEFFSAELSEKCKTPPGYTDQQWKEHMGHHPDRYKECLQ